MIPMDAAYSPVVGLTVAALIILVLAVVAAVVVAIVFIVRAVRRKPTPATPYAQMPDEPGQTIVPPLAGDAPLPPQD